MHPCHSRKEFEFGDFLSYHTDSKERSFLSLLALFVPLMLTVRPMKMLMYRLTMPLGLIGMSTMRSCPITKGMLLGGECSGDTMDWAGAMRDDWSQSLVSLLVS